METSRNSIRGKVLYCTSSRAGCRAKSSRWRLALRCSSLCRSISSLGARSRRWGRRASGREFFKSKMLQAQLPRGVSSIDIDRRFRSSCKTTDTQKKPHLSKANKHMYFGTVLLYQFMFLIKNPIPGHPGNCCCLASRRLQTPVWGGLSDAPSVCPECWD